MLPCRSSETKSLKTGNCSEAGIKSWLSGSSSALAGGAQGLGKFSPLPCRLQNRFCRAGRTVMPNRQLRYVLREGAVFQKSLVSQQEGFMVPEGKKNVIRSSQWLSLCHCSSGEGHTSVLLSLLLWLFSYQGLLQNTDSLPACKTTNNCPWILAEMREKRD